MAKAAGLPWDVILGSDVSRAYKPSPEAYRTPAALLGLDPGEVMLAAAHHGDLAAARRTGLATAFIARPAEYGPRQAIDIAPADDWDLAATSITDLARQLRAGPQPAQRATAVPVALKNGGSISVTVNSRPGAGGWSGSRTVICVSLTRRSASQPAPAGREPAMIPARTMPRSAKAPATTRSGCTPATASPDGTKAEVADELGYPP